ncbi:PRC-barrel domain-containing protein [Arthrobacter sp. H41]|uniref:PRC-barrel domain-containing protein n=1 Tax=Arthrobacter sp. H41 TaxID=1312978 RepID=UPI00047E188D|nr:PRC-barrel domain-containing protein [Arthrobacter sp. H41]
MAQNKPGKMVRLTDTGQAISAEDEDIRDRTVRDRDGEELGRIDDLLVDDEQNRVRLMEVASGGFLGMGETKSFIPIEAITRITDDEVHIDQTRDHVAGAPAYDPEIVDQQDSYGDIYGYYGYQPYWTAGYMVPPRPY